MALTLAGIVALVAMLGGGGKAENLPGGGSAVEEGANVWVYRYSDRLIGSTVLVAMFLGGDEVGLAISEGGREEVLYANNSVAIQVGGGLVQMLSEDRYMVMVGGVVVEPLTGIGIAAEEFYSQLIRAVNRSGILTPVLPYQFTPPRDGCQRVNATMTIGSIPVSEEVEVCVSGGVVTRVSGRSIEVELVDSGTSGPGFASFVEAVNELLGTNLSLPHLDLGRVRELPRYAAVVIRGADPRAPEIVKSVLNGSADPDYYVYGDPLEAINRLVHIRHGSGDLIVIELLDPRCPFCAKLHYMLRDLATRLAEDATYIAVLTPTASSGVCSQPTDECAKSASAWEYWSSLAESGGDVVSAIHRFYVIAEESGFDSAVSTVGTSVSPEDAHRLFTEASNAVVEAMRNTWLGVVVNRPVTPVLIILWPAE